MEIKKLTTIDEYRQIEEINAMSFFYSIDDEATYKPKKNVNVWGAVEGNRVLAVIHVPEYEMLYHGTYIPMFGIGGVSTRAECRNKGYIRMLFSAIFEDMEQRGAILSYLYPFSFSYYEKFGYSLGITRVKTRIKTEQLGDFRCTSDVSLYKKGDDQRPYAEVFTAFASCYTGMVKRNDWKRLEEYKASENQKYMYLFRIDGKPTAFLGFSHEVQEGARVMLISDMAWTDVRAFREILGFIGGMKAHLPVCEMWLPNSLPLDRMLGDLYSPQRSLNSFGQVRIMDVRRALELYSWPRAAGTIILRVRDETVLHNYGTFHVTYHDGTAQIEKTDAQPDLELDIRALNPLLLGTARFEDLQYMNEGWVTVNSNQSELKKVFVNRPAFITEYF